MRKLLNYKNFYKIIYLFLTIFWSLCAFVALLRILNKTATVDVFMSLVLSVALIMFSYYMFLKKDSVVDYKLIFYLKGEEKIKYYLNRKLSSTNLSTDEQNIELNNYIKSLIRKDIKKEKVNKNGK